MGSRAPLLFADGWVRRGISGQTTPQMLLRFRADVVALHPRVVHIMAGTNDIAGDSCPSTVRMYQDNIAAMVEIAQANEIEVVIGSILPANRFFWAPAAQPAPRITQLNRWLRNCARRAGLAYIDYHSALAGPGGALSALVGNDGVHPNRDGYHVMSDLARHAIEH